MEMMEGGFNSSVAARIHTPRGPFFVKALPADHPRVWTQQREAQISTYVARIAPRVLAHIQQDDWDVLVTEAIEGRHPDYRPTSPDLPAIVDALCWLSYLDAPAGVEVKNAAERLAAFVPADQLHLFEGDTLCHTDPNPSTLLVDGGRVKFVDWAWATRGPAWLDAGYWLLWLIAEGGQTPEAAHAAAARVPAFQQEPASVLTVFADAQADLWASIAAAPWTQRMQAGTKAWADYLRTTT
ncbi:aminoglycoside phosphotransferase [Streptomyces sp. NPDC059900]|uniref:aminoglycoside phosphotransferase n=1 Tax=Streptomyces sp. NPDC059900 TaxID=3155816 RepID=UPI00341DFCA9